MDNGNPPIVRRVLDASRTSQYFPTPSTSISLQLPQGLLFLSQPSSLQLPPGKHDPESSQLSLTSFHPPTLQGVVHLQVVLPGWLAPDVPASPRFFLPAARSGLIPPSGRFRIFTKSGAATKEKKYRNSPTLQPLRSRPGIPKNSSDAGERTKNARRIGSYDGSSGILSSTNAEALVHEEFSKYKSPAVRCSCIHWHREFYDFEGVGGVGGMVDSAISWMNLLGQVAVLKRID
ncbi:hypothetical protein DFH08DRAFT_813687 [Mycena albidolilacea]|uniref:Uncharacterized protein n=1 Tax=Mycena albidolilacea TaxID=1033008 RepID=A0AAD7EL53_9AGAR|nr:hypothetical protein DFH08DRAFT_813687 [Mycena albidolilacea]